MNIDPATREEKGEGAEAKPDAAPKQRAARRTGPVRVDGGIAASVALREIDLENQDFRFRVSMRIGDLVKSIKQHGQQFPVLLRKLKEPRKGKKFQVISGFRRISAITEIGGDSVNAIIREDLNDDAAAFRVSVIENEERHTYSDLDRGYAIVAYRTKFGMSKAEVSEVFNVGSRQIERLQKLTTFPEVLQLAIAEDRVPTTHALRLMQHVGKHPDADLAEWIQWVEDNQPSMRKLNGELTRRIASKRAEQPIEFFVKSEKDGKTMVRVRPIAIDENLTADQKEHLLEDLQHLLEFVKGL